MGEILHIGGTKPIMPTPIRAIVAADVFGIPPILSCSWPTKILREQGMDVQFKGISRTISKSNISDFKLQTQRLENFISPPKLILESIQNYDNPEARIMHVIKGLGTTQDFIEWRERIVEDNRKIEIVRKEILGIKTYSGSDPFGTLKGPRNELPLQDSSNRKRYWAIFKTSSLWGERDYWLFTTGMGNKWNQGQVVEIPGGMVRYLLRLLSVPKSIEVIPQNEEYSKIRLDGVPPTSGRRLLHLLGSRDVTELDDKKSGKLVFIVPKRHVSGVVELLCKYFFYRNEGGPS